MTLRRRRGNAVTTVAAIVPMLGFVALVVDVGFLQSTYTQLQVSADAAALAGAGHLDGTADGLVAAHSATRFIASQNSVFGTPVTLDDEDVVFGYYDADQRQFVESTDPAVIDAVRVDKDVQQIATFFAAAAFGEQFMQTSARALASRTADGVGATECYLPIAIPDCFLVGQDLQPFTVRMSSAQADNAGWSDLTANPSAAIVRDQIAGQCSGGVAMVGDMVNLDNGQITSALLAIESALAQSQTFWNTSHLGSIPTQMEGSTHPAYGQVLEGPIIVFHPASGVCGTSTQFNQSAPIVGFVWATVYDVRSSGSGQTVEIYVDPRYEQTGGLAGGGMDTNFSYVSIGLVH